MNRLLIELGFSKVETEKTLTALAPVNRVFERGETIMEFEKSSEEIGFLTNGTAYLINSNFDGQTGIMNYYINRGVFGSPLSSEPIGSVYYINAKTKCEVSFFSFHDILQLNKPPLTEYIITQSSKKHQTHAEILSQRSTKAKLSCFLKYLSGKSSSRQVRIPMTFSDLADYLAVDRSAMMRELRRMNEEGLIHSDGKKVLLIKLS